MKAIVQQIGQTACKIGLPSMLTMQAGMSIEIHLEHAYVYALRLGVCFFY